MANITFSEASGVNDSIYGKSQAPIRALIEKRGEMYESQSALPYLFNMETSDRWAEKLTTLTAMDNFQPVGENGAYPVTGMQEGFSKTIEHMVWRNSFSISREMIADSKSLDLKKQPVAFTSAAYRTREEFGASLYGAGLQGKTSFKVGKVTFDATCADGKALFAVDHPSKVKGITQANMFSDMFTGMDALAALECKMQDFRGDNGELLDVSPDTIVIPNIAQMKLMVMATVGSDKWAGENMGSGIFNFTYGRWNVVVWNYLNKYITDENMPWILLDSRYNETYNGAVWFDREKLNVRSVIDNTNDANIFLGYARWGAGFSDWRYAAVGGISGAPSAMGVQS